MCSFVLHTLSYLKMKRKLVLGVKRGGYNTSAHKASKTLVIFE
jgi:hypothetical protein